MNSKLVRDALASLDNAVFTTKEAVEDAVYPLFSPLQALFQGEGHRDLVDRLLRARWLEFVRGKGWILTLPAIEKFNMTLPLSSTVPPEANAFETKSQSIDPATERERAIAAILQGNYKDAIRILTILL
jgi:hypothetical protein